MIIIIVDIADQYRSNYIIQFQVRRTWLPLFFWLLDTAIINSLIIYRKEYTNSTISHKDFRLEICFKLIEEAIKEYNPLNTRNMEEQNKKMKEKKVYVTNKYQLPLSRFANDKHLPIYKKNRKACLWCRFKNKAESQSDASSSKPTYYESNIYCSFCDVALCINNLRNCFNDFHSKEND